MREKFDGDLIAFKAELGYDDLLNESRRMIEEYALKFVVANDIRDVKVESTKVLIVTKNSVKEFSGKKAHVALKIMQFYSDITVNNV